MYTKSKELIKKIRSYESKTKPLPQFFSKAEIKKMLVWSEACFRNQGDTSFRLQDLKVKDNDRTGSPSGSLKSEICHFLSQKMDPVINSKGDLKLEYSVAFHGNKKAYGIHTDSGYDPEELIYKQGIIPLVNEPEDKNTHTIILNQKCYHSSSFPNISKDKKAQKDVFDLDFKTEICPTTYAKYWKNTKIRKEQMKGFSVDYPFEWKVGDTVVWDRSRIHCSSDFEATGIKFKLGLMWISKIL